jgi:uncharacterized protein YutE (UPF0331/DUF86 family)
MVISNLNTKLLQDRLASIVGYVERLRNLAKLDQSAFLQDDTPAIAESYLRRSLEAMFDIGRHIIAKHAGKAAVEYKEIARLLGKIDAISDDLSEKLVLMAGYRNRMVHFYHEVSDPELHQILTNNLADIEKFIKEMASLLEAYQKKEWLR